MGRQIGIIKLKGTLDNLTFYEMDGETYVRTKSSLTAEQVNTSPAFARTRENAQEFKNATQATKMIKRSLLPVLLPKNYFIARLNSIGTKALKQDTTHPRGQRTVKDGNVFLYYGFEGVANVLGIDYFDGTVNLVFSVPNTFDIEILPFVPFTDLSRPGGATHVRFDFGFGLINLDTEQYVSASQIGNYVPVTQNFLTPTVNYTLPLTLLGANYATACMTLKFYQLVNGVYYELFENQGSALILSQSF
jgi:hypothetical protein